MRLSRALAITHDIAATSHALDGLGELLDPDLVKSAFETAGVATLRKRRFLTGAGECPQNRLSEIKHSVPLTAKHA